MSNLKINGLAHWRLLHALAVYFLPRTRSVLMVVGSVVVKAVSLTAWLLGLALGILSLGVFLLITLSIALLLISISAPLLLALAASFLCTPFGRSPTNRVK